MYAKLVPVLLAKLDSVVLRGLLDVGERELAIGVRRVGHLVEARDGVTHVPRIGHRFLTLFRKGVDAGGQIAAHGQPAVLFVGLPSCSHEDFLTRLSDKSNFDAGLIGASRRPQYHARMPAAALIAALAGHLNTWPCTAGQARVPATCGTYSVYENRAAHTGRTLELSFVVIRAQHPTDHAVAWNPGGPGASSTAAADAIADGGFARELGMLRDRYDVLLLDNRGTGKSAPQQCDLSPMDRPAPYFMQLWPDTLLRDCRAKLARGADLSLYTTSIAADDLNDVRGALGYPQLVLDGG